MKYVKECRDVIVKKVLEQGWDTRTTHYTHLCTQDSSCVFAMHCRQRHSEVFELIKERKLYSALVENLLPLMRLNMHVKF